MSSGGSDQCIISGTYRNSLQVYKAAWISHALTDLRMFGLGTETSQISEVHLESLGQRAQYICKFM